MKLLAKFNLILFIIFGAGGVLISHFAYSFLIGNARREVLQEAQLMLASAESVRNYTATDLSPLLEQVPQHDARFLPETIPFYGATTTFNNLRRDNPDYRYYIYKEAALNPTNLEDRASDWEADIIYNLRNNPSHGQIIDVRSTPFGPSLYIANAIKADRGCLQCHGAPSVAPAALTAVYGSDHGFGWQNNEIVGAQIVSVPMAVPIEIANRAFRRLVLYLVVTMLLAIAALDVGVYWFVIRPLKIVSDSADRISRGEKNVPPIEVKGKDEIATVAASFNRMKVSLAKALRMVDES
jgi:methyl-accepting chemotaxis protein